MTGTYGMGNSGFYTLNSQLADTYYAQNLQSLNDGGLNIGALGMMATPEYSALMAEVQALRAMLDSALMASPGPLFKCTERLLPPPAVNPNVVFASGPEPNDGADGVALPSTAHPDCKWEEHGPVPFDGTAMFEEFAAAEAKDLAHEAVMKREGEQLSRAIDRMQHVANGMPVVFVPEF